ncbi:MAG: ABC transporter permease [Candidatus Moraniibacteriota bacterium]|nr:MAG: ABC transporter permease [Candidatus Moranbacteria bacterium]
MVYLNFIALGAIFYREVQRTRQVILQTIISPTLSTFLYFIVFGATVGTSLSMKNSLEYGQYIVPGLIMMALVTNALSASSSGIYFPRFSGTIIDMLTTPITYKEIILGFALGGTVRALFIGFLIYFSALFFVDISVIHPFLALFFSFLSAFIFSLLGVLVGIWAKNFEQLSLFPLLIVMPLSFTGGIFYSIEMLPSYWQKILLFNPLYYMIDGLRFSMFGIATTDPYLSSFVMIGLIAALWQILAHLFSKGYGMKV